MAPRGGFGPEEPCPGDMLRLERCFQQTFCDNDNVLYLCRPTQQSWVVTCGYRALEMCVTEELTFRFYLC